LKLTTDRRRFVLLKPTTDRHEASRGLFATAKLLVQEQSDKLYNSPPRLYLIIIIIITDLYSAFRSEDTEALEVLPVAIIHSKGSM